MQALCSVMGEIAEYHSICEKRLKKRGMIQIIGSTSSQKTHLIYGIGRDIKYNVVVVKGELRAKQFMEEYKFLNSNVCFYPAKDMLFYHADLTGNLLLQKRMEIIKRLIEEEETTIVVECDAFLDKLPTKEFVKSQVLEIGSGSPYDLEVLNRDLVELGYQRELQVENAGQFAVRGGIVDIFPLTEEVPIRIEFWGEEIDSIRSFDVESQRSIENLERIRIYPATEYIHAEIPKVSFLDYFDPASTLFHFDEPLKLVEKGRTVETEFVSSMAQRIEQGLETVSGREMIHSMDEVLAKYQGVSSIGYTLLNVRCSEFRINEVCHIDGTRVSPYHGSLETLTRDLKKYKRQGYRVLLLSGSRTRAKRLAEDLRDYDLKSFYTDEWDRQIQPEEIMVMYGHVDEGYEYPFLKFMVISESDIFGREKKKKKRRKTYDGQKIQSFNDLKVGDYVVHENHGLGIYQGIENIEREWTSKDYMKISYAQGGCLYIPATQLDLIQKYADSSAKMPKLNHLGTQEWGKAKSRVKKAVEEIAKDLVELYAKRQDATGYVFGEDTVWQREFEEMFPYEETEDQIMAIEDTKRDMESSKVMDRLICGDVGYGKTEIAIRAAFKAVQESKQVIYLVPTTILAQQHYNNFVQRMKEFPVRIELLCRFRTAAQQKKTIQDMKKGLVDIVIGTHRVLSSDIGFKDLGLLIIDEEQRFGVRHKEKIKQFKENIDVLTLTATPIPRTLHMSLIGIRDMSVLEEAPHERMPIQTYVMEYNEEMVREAIERELAREGQIYYVYNKVSNIDEVTLRIQKLVPEANVAFAHGQMKEQELERIMYDFINQEIDVLVATTIIETGLDISNVNTIIIHDSDQMGLSQLYQLRGRVGRSNRMAYAFLLYRRDKMLKEVAEKRLSAIREYTDLGSGFKISMRDLEIRGAGNLLGESQSGHMQEVGYDLYCKMLNTAVKHFKGEADAETFETAIDINVDAYIPSTYISNEHQKLDVYKRIACIENIDEMDEMLEELIDRFGDVPKKVQQLLQVALLKSLAHKCYMVGVEQKDNEYKFIMYERAKIKTEEISGFVDLYKGDLMFKVANNPYFLYRHKKNNKTAKDDPLEIVKNLLNDIKRLIEE